ncbi:MAG TPA: hypothetical protein VES67_15905 [Vicinamibacterales bacterium]|nr:hypothetical protein [Vicinamibacterales bacterium]
MTAKPRGSLPKNRASLSRWEGEGGALEQDPGKARGQVRVRAGADRLLTPKDVVGHDKHGPASVSNGNQTARRKRVP